MPSAPTNIRGAALNCRLAVKGIQNARRSFGARLARCDIAGSLFPPHGKFLDPQGEFVFYDQTVKIGRYHPARVRQADFGKRGRSP